MRLIFFLVLSIIVNITYADSVRCGNSLIKEGDHQVEVLKECGEPLFQSSVYLGRSSSLMRYKGIVYPTVTNIVEDRWTYDLGGGRYLRTLIFRNGILKRIELGDRQ